MTNPKNRILTTTIAIFFILSMMVSTSLVTNVRAGNLSIQTFAFINASPDPAGLGQTVTIGMWLGQPPPTASGPYGDRWENITIKETLPDGTTKVLGPFTSDDTGGTYTTFTPAQLGNYTFQMTFPGQTLAGKNVIPTITDFTKAFIGDYFGPSNSNIVTVTVQQQPVPTIPLTPLPTDYWQTPVSAENVNSWYTLTGNWLGLGVIFSGNTGNYNFNGNYNAYTVAPQTAHIIWTKPVAFGGALGGEFGGSSSSNYYSTSQYEPKFAPVIINGVLYYTQYPGTINNPPGIVAVDLYTGKTLWTSSSLLQTPSTSLTLGNGTTISVANGNYNILSGEGQSTVLRCGQVLDFVSPNQYGALAYLWTTGTPDAVASATHIAAGTLTYNMFDAMTGSYVLSIVNGSALTLTEDDGGNLIGYYVNATSQTLNCWNSTQCIPMNAAGWQWRPPQGAILPFNAGIMWSKPIATNISGVPLPATLTFGRPGAATGGCIGSGVILLTCIIQGETFFNGGFQIEAAYSTTTGQQLWIVNRTETPFTRVDISPVSNGIYVEINQDTSKAVGYSITTGSELWTTTLPKTNPYDSIGGFEDVAINGTLYEYGFGGDVYAINMATGVILWQTNTNTLTGQAGTDTPYGVWPLMTFELGSSADGLLFLPEGHEYSPPLFHGAQQLAINTTTGKLAWSILAFDTTNPPAIAYGVMTALNAYDNQIYAYSKGPSAITVSAPQVGVSTLAPVTISGSVTDVSAGSQQQAVIANFPNGLPCVSDDSMTPFMEAVYEQQVMPHNITGVPVTLSVTDSNGNYRDIGRTTSNAYGTYSLTWTPDISGDYSVTATFEGTQSYYPSSAATAFYASAPSVTPAPTVAPGSNFATTTDFMLGVAAIIVVIVIIGVILAMLMLRKRP